MAAAIDDPAGLPGSAAARTCTTSRSSSRSAGTTFYADGRSVRPQVANTVARNQLHADTYFYTGFVNGKEGDGLPFPVTMKVLERGQERYNIYCTPCHSRVGNGEGMIVQRGYAHAGDFHTARLRDRAAGPLLQRDDQRLRRDAGLRRAVAPADRWAIVAYIKALQLSQKATQADVPAGAQVEPLSSIAESEGLPANFAERVDAAADRGYAARRTTRPYVLPATPPAAASGSGAPAASRPAAAKTAGRLHPPEQNRSKAVTSEASERRLETHVIWTRTYTEKHGGHHGHAHHGPRPLPASLATPEIVSAWRTRLLIVAVVATLVSVLFAFTHEGRNHLLRAYLMGFMTCFGFAGGGLVMLMLQYVTGGKWGLLLRRPLEAMSRTLWLVALMFVPIAIFMKHLYQWAAYPNPAAVAEALSNASGHARAGDDDQRQARHAEPGRRDCADHHHLRHPADLLPTS